MKTKTGGATVNPIRKWMKKKSVAIPLLVGRFDLEKM